MPDLLKHVEEYILSRQMLRRGQAVVVAVSGGLDSMVLLHVLRALATKYEWKLAVAHFNHQLRGKSSDADERLVREASKKLGLKCVVGRKVVKEFARNRKLSVEMAARTLRHEFLARATRELKCRTVALAHHADDQVELFFLRLFRGAGGEGLAGMKWNSRSAADNSIELVRPLLDVNKAELAQWAQKRGIRFREDATNNSTDFLRNRIRHKLLPLLRREFQPALDVVVPRVMNLLREESGFTITSAESWLSDPKARTLPFEKLPTAVQRRVLQLQFFSHHVTLPEFDLIERLRTAADKAVSIAPGILASRDTGGRLRIERVQDLAFSTRECAAKLKNGAGEVLFDGATIEWELKALEGRQFRSQTPQYEQFDADEIGTSIVVRHWHPGDRFQPIGMRQPVKLQNWFTNLKIPAAQRRQLLVAVAKGGEIFWVEGQRISERFKLTQKTRRCLGWRWQRL